MGIEGLRRWRTENPDKTITWIAQQIGCCRERLSYCLNHDQEFKQVRLRAGLAVFLYEQQTPKVIKAVKPSVADRVREFFRRETWQ